MNTIFKGIHVALLLSSVVCGAAGRKPPGPIRIAGATMGTTYHVTYFDKQGRNFKAAIDSVLRVVNQSINHYDPTSAVSAFNKGVDGLSPVPADLRAVLEKSRAVWQQSGGAFDPTVAPLVNAWGFGPGKAFVPAAAQLDSLLSFTGFGHVDVYRDRVAKNDPRVQLDFGGIGQGYGADRVAAYLQSKGIGNMLVEIGGEGMAIGKNLSRREPWRVGILDPRSTIDQQFYTAYVALADQSFTTSGNYFNYYELDGVRYSHTIDPRTGTPARQTILSASVFAADCQTADAWATAFMVMGHEKAITILNDHPELQALLLYSNADGSIGRFVTPGVAPHISFEPSQQP